MMKRFFIAAFCGFLLSCASANLEQNPMPKIFVTNTKTVRLLPSQNAAESVDGLQLLEADFGGNQMSALCYVQIDSGKIYVALLNDFGTTMGELVFEGTKVDFNSALMPSDFKAEYIIADIQDAWYSTEALSENYSKAKLDFSVENDGQQEIRKIQSSGKLIKTVTKNGASVRIENHLRNYTLNLTAGEEE